MREKTI